MKPESSRGVMATDREALLARLEIAAGHDPVCGSSHCRWCGALACQPMHHRGGCVWRLLREAAALLAAEAPVWRTAAYLKDRTRRAITERVRAGEPASEVASDYGVPVEWVTTISAYGYDIFFTAPPTEEA